MAGQHPTVPPPRRRAEDKKGDTPSPISSDPRELVLRELRDVEARAKTATERAISELSDVFERRVAELEQQLEDRDETIRKLQRADSDALLDHETLRELVAAMGRRLSSELTTSVTAEVRRQLSASAAVEGAEAGATAGRAAGGRAGAKWSPIAAFIGAVIAAAVSTGVQKCSTAEEAPKPAVPVPANGAGYGGRK